MNAIDLEPTRRDDLSGLLTDIESLERIFAGWDADQRHATGRIGARSKP
jgi:hypothetical protein